MDTNALRALELSARGLHVPEVAAEMGIPAAAVRAHLAAALRGLEANSKLEAVLIASRLGLIRVGRER